MDPDVINRSDLFDVFVNLPDSEITVAQHAKGKTLKGELATHDKVIMGVVWTRKPVNVSSVKKCCLSQ